MYVFWKNAGVKFASHHFSVYQEGVTVALIPDREALRLVTGEDYGKAVEAIGRVCF